MSLSGRTGFVYHEDYLLHDTGRFHPESPDRLRAIVGHLKGIDLLSELE
ncbi:histone deacetylase, partial [Candidatus Poribacteria bacterium]